MLQELLNAHDHLKLFLRSSSLWLWRWIVSADDLFPQWAIMLVPEKWMPLPDIMTAFD